MIKKTLLFLALTVSLLMPASVVLAQGGSIGSSSGVTNLSNFKLLPSCLTDSTVDAQGKTKLQEAGFDCVKESITHFTNLLLVVIAIGAFFYLLYGAFLYVTAFNDEAKVKTAKSVIKYALIAVIIASLSVAVVSLLADVLKINVPIDAIK